MKNKLESIVQGTIGNFSKKFHLNNRAQGTIEYLIILAIIVVIGLIVVGVSTNFFDTVPSIQSGTNSISSQTGSSIVVKEAVVDNEGVSLLSLQNNTGETLTLEKIVIGEEEKIYEVPIFSGTNPLISLNSESCFCTSGEKTKECTYEIYTTSKHNLEKKETIKVTLECVEEAISENPFISEKFNLDVSFTGEGSVNSSGVYSPGQTINISATPSEGWKFVNWTTSNGGTFANANLASTTFTMPNNSTTITANFEEMTMEDQYFIFLIRTMWPDHEFRIYIADAVDLNINWGDGDIEIINGTEFKSHTYSEVGDYNIWLEGSASKISFGENQSGTSHLLITTYTPIQNGVTGITDMSQMFMEAWRFNGDVSDWDTSNVTDMGLMFSCHEGDGSFSGDVSDWDTSNVTSMSNMFNGQRNFNSDIGNWNTSKLENAAGMFHGAADFNQDISKWDMSNVNDMSRMFFGATSFNQDINDWNTSNVTSMIMMFSVAYNFNQDLSGWDTSKVEDVDRMFYLATSFNQDISAWDMSNVENMYEMFGGASSFNQDLDSWDTSNVSNMSMMFYNASSFNGDISGWDVSNVGNMSRMFDGASSFNRDISNWETYNVDYMDNMFRNASSFNQDLSGWDVSAVIEYTDFDDGATAWQEEYKPNFS